MTFYGYLKKAAPVKYSGAGGSMKILGHACPHFKDGVVRSLGHQGTGRASRASGLRRGMHAGKAGYSCD